MVGLENYADGFGENAGELLKAMQAGQITGRDTSGLSLTQEPLKVESLETALKVLDARTQDIKLFNALPKLTAYNTVEEYLQLASYGDVTGGGFYDEGELSDVVDSTYIRRAEHVKYLQVTGEVTLQAQMVRSYVDAYKQEMQNKMMLLMKKVNGYLTKADSDVVVQEFNGLYKQHQAVGTGTQNLFADNHAYYKSNTVIDMRGKSVKQEDIEKAAIMIDQNYGTATDLFGPTTVISTLSQDYYNRQRFMISGNNDASISNLGVVPTSVATTVGAIKLNSDKFMKAAEPKSSATGATNAQAPSAPTFSLLAAAVDAKSKFVAGDAGNVYYAVSAVNKRGESALTVFPTAVSIVAGSSVDLTITAVAGANATQGLVIYRSERTTAGTAAGLLFHQIFKVAASVVTSGYDGGAAGVIRDRGMFLPNTDQAFITQLTEDVMSIKQLAPMSKLDLAILSPSRRFLLFNFLTPIVYQTQKMVRFINCGRTLTV